MTLTAKQAADKIRDAQKVTFLTGQEFQHRLEFQITARCRESIKESKRRNIC